MSNYLHIVCLDAPSPPDYGGAIDMYYKIKALAETGKQVLLHYFDYNPLRNSNGLQEYCTAIYAYKRKSFFNALPLSRPFIVQSRINNELIDRLNKDDHPVLLEGLHCAGIIPFLTNKERVVIRMHNEEASYYHHLANTERFFFRKLYFTRESNLLQSYQHHISKKVKLACLSQTDIGSFQNEYGFQDVHFIPCFIPWQVIGSKEGKGEYCLYHGNLSVSENAEAAVWLIQNIFSQVDIPFVVAGKNISSNLLAYSERHENIVCVNNPSIDEINELVKNAQINVLPSMNATGVKLKLLNALLNGRFCITNHNGVMGSGLQKFVMETDVVAEWITLIFAVMQKEFTAEDVAQRKQVLHIYDNKTNADKLNALW